MKYSLRRALLLGALVVSAGVAFAHPGGLDKNGCHVDSKTGKQHCHRKELLDLSKPFHAGDEGALYGALVRVIDGDTIVVKIQGAELEFRLAEIDAPESEQPYGKESRQQLAALIGEQQCVLVPLENDHYGRLVAHLWVSGTYVNEEMISRGAAWFDAEYGRHPFLYQVENEARDTKVGLWALPSKDRVPPWEWRHDKR